MEILVWIFVLAYLAIGCVFNGILNEDWQMFSLFLMLFWPVALGMILIGGFLALFVDIGKWIKNKMED